MSSDPIGDLQGLTFSSSSSYTVIEEIGRGGMGIVFLAERNAEGVTDEVVLKTLRTLTPEHLENLKREANIATRLRHENIVKTYGLEAIPTAQLPDSFRREIESLSPEKARRRSVAPLPRGGDLRRHLQRRRMEAHERAAKDERTMILMVMDYVEGTDLRTLHLDLVRRKRLLPCALSAFIISRVCRALGYAHASIIHRDISPENILINTQGVAKLSDFGVAVETDGAAKQMAGKLGFMSPEQLRGEKVDARSDIYSLGLVLYQILTGVPVRYPVSGSNITERIEETRRRAKKDPIPPHEIRADVPRVLSDICVKMIARDREQRIPRAEDAGNLLEQKYLYAEGFGPTNNSLAAYSDLLERDFSDPTQDELRQLGFLKSPEGRIRLQRPIRSEDYTDAGRALIAQQEDSLLHRIMTGMR